MSQIVKKFFLGQVQTKLCAFYYIFKLIRMKKSGNQRKKIIFTFSRSMITIDDYCGFVAVSRQPRIHTRQ